MLRVDYTFDIETIGWTRFYAGSLFDGQDVSIYDDADAMFSALAMLPAASQVWAHNGGKFDFVWLCQQLSDAGIHATLYPGGSRISRLTIEDGPTLRDSYPLIPMALNDRHSPDDSAAVDLIGRACNPLDLPCICSTRAPCGGYCSIGRSEYAGRVREYLEADVRDLYDVLSGVSAELARHDIDARGSQAATGWALVRSMVGIEPARWASWPIYRFAADAYYGGRAEVFATRSDTGYRYDMNSAYPWALATARVPMGASVRLPRDRAARAWDRGRPGIYRARVTVPDHLAIPPLPMRHRDRVYWPVGSWSGTFARAELLAAMDSGARIDRIISALVYTDDSAELSPVATHLWQLRSAARNRGDAEGVAWGRMYKGIAVSLIGKLAQRPEGSRIEIHPDTDKIRLCSGKRTCSPTRCSGHCRAWQPLDRDASIWRVPYWAIPSCAHVQAAGALTAHVRIELRRQLLGHDPLYCHTDSVFSGQPRRRRIGDELGQWRDDGSISAWRAMGPGQFAYRDEAGHEIVGSKGVARRLSADEYDRYASGEQLSFDSGVKTLAAALRDGGPIFARQELLQRRWELRDWVGGRLLDRHTGRTRPPTVAEILARKRTDGRSW